MAETFPADLIDAQHRLHQAWAQYRALGESLPWSAEPATGWPGEVHPHTGVVTGGREDSRGYTAEQQAEVARLRALVLDLSVQVSTHPYWSTLDRSEVVAARMALKVHPSVAVDAA